MSLYELKNNSKFHPGLSDWERTVLSLSALRCFRVKQYMVLSAEPAALLGNDEQAISHTVPTRSC